MNNELIKNGRSGCTFQINQKTSRLLKISKNEEYNIRLLKQFKKQKNFNNSSFFKTPKIYRSGKKNNLFYFEMDYIKGKTFDRFCLESKTNELIDFGNKLIFFVKNNYSNSKKTSIESQKFEEKIINIKKQSKINIDLYIKFLLKNMIETLKIGYCHGDLTMANIIFSNHYYFIDFLDNIYESPINDIVKIKQDSEHNFFLTLSTNKNNKIKIYLDYIDQLINKNFDDIINNKDYIWFSIYNLIRVIPYLNEKKEIELIVSSLKKYEYHITSRRQI